MKNPLQHVIWDWNGTLLDDVDVCIDAINCMLTDRGLACLTRDTYRDLFDFPVKSYYRRIGFDLNAEHWDDVVVEFFSHYNERVASAPLRPWIPETLAEMKRRVMRMSVLSACEQTTLRALIQTHGISDFFEHIYGLNDRHAVSKMSLGKALLAELNIAPDTVVIIGDTVHDYDVAMHLGCACILIRDGYHADHRLDQCNCPIVSSPEETLELTERTT